MSIIATPLKKRALFKRVQQDDFVEFLFSIAYPQVGEPSSKPDSKEFVMFRNPTELKAKLNNGADTGDSTGITIYYPSTRGFIYLHHTQFDPAYVQDRKFQYSAFGWGLFHIYFEPLEDSEKIICTVAYCERQDIRKTKRLLKEFKSPSLWDWNALEQIQKRVSGFIDALEWQASRQEP